MDWWHEDPEMLSATLYMLANAEEDPHASAATTHASMSYVEALTSVAAPPPPPFPFRDAVLPKDTARPKSTKRELVHGRPKVINVSRERRRDETRYLRGQVAELEAQLSILQHRREQMLRPHLTETGEIRSVAAVWEEMATRQVREVTRSRVTNAKLKTMVENQVRVAEDLLAAVRKAEEESKKHRDDADGLLTLARPRLAIDISQKISEEDQLARLEVLCAQWRDAFAWSPRFRDGTSLRFFEVKLVDDTGDAAVVDVFGSWALPFPRDKVEDAFWRFYLEEDAQDDGNSFAQDYVSRDNTIVGVFRARTTVDTHRVTFNGKYVGKRLRCPQGRMVVVSHMYSEPRCKSNLLDNVALEEDSWMRIVDSQSVGGPALTYPLTLIQHVRRMHIRFGGGGSQSSTLLKKDTTSGDRNSLSVPLQDDEDDEDAVVRRQASALTEFMMLQVEDEMTRGEQCIENMLLDDFGKLSFALAPPPSAMEGQTMVV